MKIAITGGIGSGKSTVLKILSLLGEKTISFDEVYKSLLADENFLKGVYFAAGTEPQYKNDKIIFNAKKISEAVFSCPEKLNALNSFTHAKIFEKAFSEGRSFECSGGRVFYEVPLLFEGNYQNRFDKVWVVMRDKNARIISAATRDELSESEIEKRINNQFDYESSDLSLHTLILNDGDEESLKNKVERAIYELETCKTKR